MSKGTQSTSRDRRGRPSGDGSRSRVSPAAASGEPVALFVIEVYPQDDQGRWVTRLGVEGDWEEGPDPVELMEIVRVVVDDLAVVPANVAN